MCDFVCKFRSLLCQLIYMCQVFQYYRRSTYTHKRTDCRIPLKIPMFIFCPHENDRKTIFELHSQVNVTNSQHNIQLILGLLK